jgi:hypothetical protein
MRHELKFACEERAYARVLANLRLSPMALREDHPPRVVQSIYFDTYGNRALADNLAGIADRQKLRFRWYGDAAEAVHGHLEVKFRRGILGDKLFCEVPAPVQVRGVSRIALQAALCAQIPVEWRLRFDGHEPVQWIRYVRDYLVSADGRLRVTLDRELVAFDQRTGFLLQDRRATPLPRLLIIEVKGPDEERTALEQLLQEIGLHPGRCSKFVLASAPADGPAAALLGD